jgi:hypothetical protein
MVLEALNAGKHVFVEKPLALKREDLREDCRLFRVPQGRGSHSRADDGIQPAVLAVRPSDRELVQERRNPMILNYRMNAGYIPLDHWVHGEEGEAGTSEACHVYDLFTFLTGAIFVLRL